MPSFLSLLPLRPVVAAGGSLLMPGAGKETRLQCSFQEIHFIDRKGPGSSAQGLSVRSSNRISGEGPLRPPTLPDLSAGAPDRAAGWPSQSLHRSFTEQRATGLPGDWSQ